MSWLLYILAIVANGWLLGRSIGLEQWWLATLSMLFAFVLAHFGSQALRTRRFCQSCVFPEWTPLEGGHYMRECRRCPRIQFVYRDGTTREL